MSSKAQALRVARRWGFVLDESVSGKIGLGFMATFDHPTHAIGPDCHSVHDEDISGEVCWANCIARMEEAGPLLEPCTDPKCDYHHPE